MSERLAPRWIRGGSRRRRHRHQSELTSSNDEPDAERSRRPPVRPERDPPRLSERRLRERLEGERDWLRERERDQLASLRRGGQTLRETREREEVKVWSGRERPERERGGKGMERERERPERVWSVLQRSHWGRVFKAEQFVAELFQSIKMC